MNIKPYVDVKVEIINYLISKGMPDILSNEIASPIYKISFLEKENIGNQLRIALQEIVFDEHDLDVENNSAATEIKKFCRENNISYVDKERVIKFWRDTSVSSHKSCIDKIKNLEYMSELLYIFNLFNGIKHIDIDFSEVLNAVKKIVIDDKEDKIEGKIFKLPQEISLDKFNKYRLVSEKIDDIKDGCIIIKKEHQAAILDNFDQLSLSYKDFSLLFDPYFKINSIKKRMIVKLKLLGIVKKINSNNEHLSWWTNILEDVKLDILRNMHNINFDGFTFKTNKLALDQRLIVSDGHLIFINIIKEGKKPDYTTVVKWITTIIGSGNFKVYNVFYNDEKNVVRKEMVDLTNQLDYSNMKKTKSIEAIFDEIVGGKIEWVN